MQSREIAELLLTFTSEGLCLSKVLFFYTESCYWLIADVISCNVFLQLFCHEIVKYSNVFCVLLCLKLV